MKKPHSLRKRWHEISRIRGELERSGFPRLMMLLLVVLTGGAGFITSFGLLSAGITEMWVRYLLSVGIAYLVFLILLWLWLRTKAVDYLEPGLPDLLSPIDVHAHGAEYSGKGGTFDGGGASGWYETPSDVSLGYGKDSGIGKAIDAVGDADDFAIPLVVMILVAAAVASIAVASLFVVHSAPVLFAELVVDGVLSARLLHRLRDIERRHWLETALHRTALPFAATAAIASACGWAMAQYAPEAHSIGEFMLYINRQAWWVD